MKQELALLLLLGDKMVAISKDEIIEKLNDFELINKAVKGAIEEDENHGNLVYFVAINEVINLINECTEIEIDN